MNLLHLSYWQYLFQKPWTWTKVWCRYHGHREGVVWFTHRYEPDMRCKNCGDDLG